jgi:hypothetical protein
MNKEHYLLTLGILILSAVLGLTGCLVSVSVPGKVTGGGWMPSVSDVEKEKATFGFNADSCDGLEYAQGHFNFHDKYASDFPEWPGGVKMKGDILEAYKCELQSSDTNTSTCYCGAMLEDIPWHEIRVQYRSTNPKCPGEGEAIVCIWDNGEGENAELPDTARIEVWSGPYVGYQNEGFVKGNVQSHECEEY